MRRASLLICVDRYYAERCYLGRRYIHASIPPTLVCFQWKSCINHHTTDNVQTIDLTVLTSCSFSEATMTIVLPITVIVTVSESRIPVLVSLIPRLVSDSWSQERNTPLACHTRVSRGSHIHTTKSAIVAFNPLRHFITDSQPPRTTGNNAFPFV